MIGLSPLSAAHPLGFQPKWVRPSTGSYPRFSLAADRSPGFASTECDYARHLKDSLSLRLAFKLNLAACRDSLAHSTKGTPSHRSGCSGRLRARGFRYCFTPLAGCFSPFPHGTGSLSVTGECLALEGGPPCFPPGFTCPAVLGYGPRGGWGFAYGALTRCGRPSHAVPLPHPFLTAPRVPGPGPGPPATPDGNRPGALPPIGFGLVRFRSPLLAQSRLISLPPGT